MSVIVVSGKQLFSHLGSCTIHALPGITRHSGLRYKTTEIATYRVFITFKTTQVFENYQICYIVVVTSIELCF